MQYHVIIMPPVVAALPTLVRKRNTLLMIYNRLYAFLERSPDRSHRDPEDNDYLFYRQSVYSNGRWLTLTFSVNDCRANDYLFVDAVTIEPPE